jgi:hypothetical protein
VLVFQAILSARLRRLSDIFGPLRLNIDSKYCRHAKKTKTRYADTACTKTASRTFPPNPPPIPVRVTSTIPAHLYEVRPRKDKRGVDLISDVLPFGRLWYGDTNAVANAIGYTAHCSRSHGAVIRIAAIIRAKPEQIPAAKRLRRLKRATNPKAKWRTTG